MVNSKILLLGFLLASSAALADPDDLKDYPQQWPDLAPASHCKPFGGRFKRVPAATAVLRGVPAETPDLLTLFHLTGLPALQEQALDVSSDGQGLVTVVASKDRRWRAPIGRCGQGAVMLYTHEEGADQDGRYVEDLWTSFLPTTNGQLAVRFEVVGKRRFLFFIPLSRHLVVWHLFEPVTTGD